MDGIRDLAGKLDAALRAFGHELISVRLLLQLGLILAAGAIATVAATLIRRRLDLTALTMGWPPFLRQFTRHAVANLGTIIFVAVLLVMQAAMKAADLAERLLSARRRHQPRHRLGGDRAGRRTDPQPVRLPAGGGFGLDHRGAQHSRPAASRSRLRSIRSAWWSAACASRRCW